MKPVNLLTGTASFETALQSGFFLSTQICEFMWTNETGHFRIQVHTLYFINLGPGLKENLQIQNGRQQPSFLNFAGAYFQSCDFDYNNQPFLKMAQYQIAGLICACPFAGS